MASLGDLATKMRKLNSNIDKAASNLAQKVSVDAVTYLVRNTPVDTSQALSNWQVGLGRKVQGTIPAYVVGSRGSSASESEEEAITRAKLALAYKEPGQAVYISNNLDYIYELNYENKSPQGSYFVEASIALVGINVRKYGLKLETF